jgi:hypothetical protein
MLTKIISSNPINAGSAVGNVTAFGVIHSTDTKYPKSLSQDGQYDFNENSQVFVPVSGGVGTLSLVAGIANRQLTIDEFSFSASGTSAISFFSSGTGASPVSQQLLAGPYQTVAGTLVTGGPFRTRVGENLVVNNSAGLIGGSLVYRIE